jgi:hypothetical protein
MHLIPKLTIRQPKEYFDKRQTFKIDKDTTLVDTIGASVTHTI